jgi:lipooligosaccharide transport system permease protein
MRPIKEDKGQFALVMRFIVMPLFLFSGTFFPLDTLPIAVRWIGWISPIWHGTELGRVFTYGIPGTVADHHPRGVPAGDCAGWLGAVRRQFVKRMGS